MHQDQEDLLPPEYPITAAHAVRLRARARAGLPGAGEPSLEERSWAWLYASIGDPSVARQVVKELQEEPGEHHALFIRASITVDRHEQRVARSRALGHALRSLARVPARAWRWCFGLVHVGGAVLDALPAHATPATRARSIVSTLERDSADTPKVPAQAANG